jgi:hypothetical protein
MVITQAKASGPLVLQGRQTGVTIIPAGTPLTRLNYFDGKFLRAQDLQAEQSYLRRLVQLSNQANGSGVVHGFDLALAGGDRVALGAGLAIDPQGRVLLLPQEHTVSIQELIDSSREAVRILQPSGLAGTGVFAACEEVSAPDAPGPVASRDWYLITIAQAEALCGEEDVYGKLCEEACITSTDRPWRLEGVVLRALPLSLFTPLAQSNAVALDRSHLRSLVASAYFADEAKRLGSLISGAGLQSPAWCRGASAFSGNEVALGVLIREGGSTIFLDEWIARRELMETPPRRYWQWRMAMRPWDAFLAQVLQFQCQLHDLFRTATPEVDDDPCAQAKVLVAEAAEHFKVLSGYYKQTTAKLAKMSKSVRERLLEEAPEFKQGFEKFAGFEDRLLKVSQAFTLMPQDRLLIRRGIVELPSAGYLPVVPGSTVSVNQQVRRMLGEGVDLRFCIVRPDFVPHALEEAQHMERISLLEGLDDSERKPRVDVLVPNGRIAPDRVESGRFYEMRLNVIPENLTLLAQAANSRQRAKLGGDVNAESGRVAALRALSVNAAAERNPEVFEYTGAARAEELQGGGLGFYYAGATGEFTLGRDTPSPAPAPAPAPATGLSESAAAAPSTAQPAAANSMLLESFVRLRAVGTAVTGLQARSSIWVSLETDLDPMELARGQSARVKGECYLALTSLAAKLSTNAASGQRVSLLRAVFGGEFEVDELDTRAGSTERLAKGTLSGELALTIQSGDERNSFSFYVSEPVHVLRSAGPYGSAFKIELPTPSILAPLVAELEVERKWDSPTTAGVIGRMTFVAAAQPPAGTNALTNAAAAAFQPALAASAARNVLRQAFRAWQTVNPAVVEPNHPAHETAIRALRTIGTALASPKFADLAAARLFPAPSAVTDLNVLATLDWVLFHRRREKTCAIDKPARQLDTREYALYHIKLSDKTSIADLERVLERGGDPVKQLGLDFVQLVDFGAGIHAVVSSHAQLRAGWRQDVGVDAGAIQGGLIASRGVAAAEGERLAEDRVQAVSDVLGTEFPVATQPQFDVLQRVPDALDTGSTDGIIVLATKQEVTTTCHEVYAAPNPDIFKLLLDAADSGALQQVLARATPLGKVSFEAQTANEVVQTLNPVVEKWKQAFGGALPQAAVVVWKAAEAATQLLTQQSDKIARALGGQITVRGTQTEPLPSDCPAISFILPASAQVQARIGRLVAKRSGEVLQTKPALIKFKADGSLDGSLPADAVQELSKQVGDQRFDPVEFAPREGKANPGADKRSQAVFEALVKAKLAATQSRLVVRDVTSVEQPLLQVNGQQVDDLIVLVAPPVIG